MDVIPVNSLDDPRLTPYANMRDAELAQRTFPHDPPRHGELGGLFVAEGELVLERLIASPFPTESVLLAEGRFDRLRDRLERLPAGTPVFVAPQSLLNRIVGFNMHRGVLAMGRRADPFPFDRLLSLPGPLLILEDLVNHDNLGGVFRNAAGLGGSGCAVLLSPRCADPLYRKSLRVSVGHVLTVPFARSRRWPDDLERLVAAGWELLALTPRTDAADLAALEPTGPDDPPIRRALLLGSEGPGLDDRTLALSRPVRIAMPPGPSGEVIDSLNVAMAAGIALHRLVRPGSACGRATTNR